MTTAMYIRSRKSSTDMVRHTATASRSSGTITGARTCDHASGSGAAASIARSGGAATQGNAAAGEGAGCLAGLGAGVCGSVLGRGRAAEWECARARGVYRGRARA